MYFLRIEEAEQERMAELLANILELNDIDRDIVLKAIENKGIDCFLGNPRLFGLSADICLKVSHIKTIVETLFKEGVDASGH